jgi:hypothetical protein
VLFTNSAIGHMTRDELRQFIVATVLDEKLLAYPPDVLVSWQEMPADVWSIFLAGFIEQENAPSARQMLREERDR